MVELDKPCPFETRKTWADVIQKLPTEERPQIIVAIDRQGGLHEVIGRKEAGEAARSLDLAAPSETRGELSPAAIQQRKVIRDAREKHERTIRAVDLAVTALITGAGTVVTKVKLPEVAVPAESVDMTA